MRVAIALLAIFVGVAPVSSQAAKEAKPAKRYGIEPDLENYPQSMPKEALASVLKAIDRRRIDYLLAQLAEPEWVDKRVKGLGGKFEDLVRETTEKLAAEPEAIAELRRFLTQGKWEEGVAGASAQLKDVQERVYFRKIDGRWFFENDKSKESGESKQERGGK